MRRLFVSVAFLAALLIAPSAALATGTPVLSGPAASNAVAPASIHLTWTSVGVLVTYRVFRATTTSGTSCSPTLPGAAAEINNGIDTTAFDDAVSAEAVYCYYVEADDLLTGPADSLPLQVIYDTTPPSMPVVTVSGGNGCATFTLEGATATDNIGPVTVTTAGSFPYSPPGATGAPFEPVSVNVTATDAAGNATQLVPPVTGNLIDPTRPATPVLEINTDPAQQKATLNWNSVPLDGAPVTGYHVHVKGPQGPSDPTLGPDATSLVFGNLQVDATYEYSLSSKDLCGESAPSVRLVRLNDTSPPTVPIVAQPTFDAASKAISLLWVPSSDNIQIDHYQVLRNGVPLGVTDTTAFTDTDTARLQGTSPSYVVRAVDTNGNVTNSDAKTAKVPDWTPPTKPVVSAKPNGTTVTVTWSGAADNIGVVGYDVLRHGKLVASMTGAVRKYIDRNVKPGTYAYAVQARDDQGNATGSSPQPVTVIKPHPKATVVGLKMAGALHGGAARYAIKGPARLLLDVRIVGDLKKAKLRVYVQSGKGRITVWRGTPGSSAPRERLHSALARHGWVTIKLNRTLHPGRTRLVLIASNRMVIVGNGAHKPSMRAG